jgi:hypothetical protein
MSGPAPSIQYANDGPGSNGSGQDGQALLWNNATGKFVMGDHGSLTGRSDDDHTQYIILTPTASARNVIQPSTSSVIPLTIRGVNGQSGDLLSLQGYSNAVLFAVTKDGGVCWTDVIANTNTPAAATKQALVIRDSSGNISGYVPVYDELW